jgi:hypothetical protein
MVLYQVDWRKVLEKLETIPKPLVELETLKTRVALALQTKKSDPFYLAITEYQTEWIWTRCRLKTIHDRRK